MLSLISGKVTSTNIATAFLRRAEYFNGLLFLTTNRVGQIDDAFISRIHVAIHYKDLAGEDLARIWKGFFAKLAKDKSVKIRIQPAAKNWVIECFAKGDFKHFNGRDIRNALQTAITLAEFEHEEDARGEDAQTDMPVTISKAHFERVFSLINDFRNYVDRIRNKDQKGRAQERLDRNDFEEGEDRRQAMKDALQATGRSGIP